MKYRPEIDGLRAIAVLTVMLYHAGFSFMSGGYLGVDIFFVISGFLITSIIRREVLNNNFSITRFYERRIRRILPALYIVMAASLSASWFIQTPQQLIAQFESILSILLYVSNFYFLSQNDYFASDAALSPLIHTWSLAVEEQFYVIFPVFLILIMKQKRVDIRLILAAACTISLGTTFFVDKYDPNANFFFTTSRVWELGIGCLLACMPAPQK
ncbi:MAG: acyltransferase, partial [Pseudomonadota bacterium]|nr:acyltransferase [Pseudomonadota bacterium]